MEQVILMVPAGAGRSKETKMLRERLELPHISSGDVLCDGMKREADKGMRAKRYMNRDVLVPDHITELLPQDRGLGPLREVDGVSNAGQVSQRILIEVPPKQ